MEYRKISELAKLENNPRNIEDEDMQRLVSSIRDNPQYFEARPLILSDRTKQLVIIAGNMRYDAAKILNLNAVPTFLIPNLTEAQEQEITIRDNVSNGMWDFEKLAKEWDLSLLADWGVNLPDDLCNPDQETRSGLTDEDLIPELPTETKIQLGDVWILGNHKVMCGDSTNANDVAVLMAGQLADLVWTDPPYNVAVNGKAGKILNDDMNTQAFNTFIAKVYHNYFNNMRQGAVIYVAHSDTERVTFTGEFSQAGFKLSQVLVWIKHSATLSRQDFNWRHEPILYGWKEGEAHYFCRDFTNDTVIDQAENVVNYQKLSKPELISEIRKLKQQPDGSTVIRHDRPVISELHPTMKPVSLVQMMIDWSSKSNWLVLDLFGGSGSTLIACEKSNRYARLMELDPKYVAVILDRWATFTGKEPTRSDGKTWSELKQNE
jgi:DNA modification methylase